MFKANKFKAHKLKMQGWNRRRGFTLIETGATIVVMSLLGMTVAPALEKARSVSQGVSSAANLQSIGQGAGAYGFSNQDRLFSYSWRANVAYLMPDGRTKTGITDQGAAANQNTEILLRRTGRLDGESRIFTNSGRSPQRRFNHLVLLDFLNESLESTKYIDPSDGQLLFWNANPLEYLEDVNTLPYYQSQDGGYVPGLGFDDDSGWTTNQSIQRWTFGSSYQCVPSSWQFDFPNVRYRPVAFTPNLFTSSGAAQLLDLHTGRRFEEVAYPSQKVWIHEEFDREQAGNPFFAYNQARVEKLMFDGSVNNWRSGDANASVVEEDGLQPWRQTYVPLHQFPIPLGGLGDPTLLSQRFRWTMFGLRGVDYGPVESPRGPRVR